MRARDEPVRLTRIYTRGGDAGETSLGDGSRVSKLDCRIGAFGTVDELNSAIGVVLAGDVPDAMRDPLDRVQNELFDVGADLSVPWGVTDRLRVEQAMIDRLEAACDAFNAELPELRSFVLPGGTEAAARLHVARTICRRAERDVLLGSEEVDLNPLVLRYLNRLSDLLFILARAANADAGRDEPLVEAWELALAAVGSFVAGYVGSMLGLVLGTLRLPLLVWLAGSPVAAAGTNIAISAAAAASGSVRHARDGARRLAPRRVDGAAVGRGRGSRRPRRGRRLGAAAPGADRGGAASGAASISRSGRFGRASGSGRGSGRRSRAASGSARSAAPSASSSARCGCRRSSAVSGWTSSALPARTSSSASCSGSRASPHMRVPPGSTGSCSPPASRERSRAAGSVRGRPAATTRTSLRRALGAVLVLVGAAFALQALV